MVRAKDRAQLSLDSASARRLRFLQRAPWSGLSELLRLVSVEAMRGHEQCLCAVA